MTKVCWNQLPEVTGVFIQTRLFQKTPVIWNHVFLGLQQTHQQQEKQHWASIPLKFGPAPKPFISGLTCKQALSSLCRFLTLKPRGLEYYWEPKVLVVKKWHSSITWSICLGSSLLGALLKWQEKRKPHEFWSSFGVFAMRDCVCLVGLWFCTSTLTSSLSKKHFMWPKGCKMLCLYNL